MHRNTVPVLQGIDFQIVQGEILAILGHSGVGKSTLLNLLGLLDVPTEGQILYHGRDQDFNGVDITRLGLRKKARIRRKRVGLPNVDLIAPSPPPEENAAEAEPAAGAEPAAEPAEATAEASPETAKNTEET